MTLRVWRRPWVACKNTVRLNLSSIRREDFFPNQLRKSSTFAHQKNRVSLSMENHSVLDLPGGTGDDEAQYPRALAVRSSFCDLREKLNSWSAVHWLRVSSWASLCVRVVNDLDRIHELYACIYDQTNSLTCFNFWHNSLLPMQSIQII